MPRLKRHSETRSISSHRADFEIIATRHGVILDVQTRTAGLGGNVICQAAMARLSIDDARELRDSLSTMLDAAEDLVDPRQSALWSDNVADAA